MSVRRDCRRAGAVAFLAVGAVILSFSCGPSLSLRTFVRDRTYPEAGSRRAAVNYRLLIYAMLRPALDRPYADCTEARRVIGAYSAELLLALGTELRRQTTARSWANVLHPNVREVAGSSVDPLLALAIGEAASDLSGFIETSVPSPQDRREALESANAVIDRLGAQIGGTGTSCGRGPGDSPVAPSTTLALSGGAANGAFTAGFLFELFYLRERIALALDDPDRAAFLRRSEFAATTGTSVGALIAQVVDLYFTRDLGSSEHTLRERLGEFRANQLRERRYPLIGPGDFPDIPLHVFDRLAARRPAQAYALGLIQEYFTDLAEGEAICVQPGSTLRQFGLFGDREVGLMRFDPLQESVIDRVLSATGSALLDNPMRRIVVSVEVLQNVAVGLDERACFGLEGEDLSECLAAGVMASVVLPVFAQPVNRVRTGVHDGPDCGIWLDAGIRNGLPAYHALMRSRPACDDRDPRVRTLAISTDRLTGMPSPPTRDSDEVLSIALQAIGEMGNQLHVVEAAYVGALASIQQERYSLLALDRPGLEDLIAACSRAQQDVAECQGVLDSVSPQQAQERCRTPLQVLGLRCNLAFEAYGERAGHCPGVLDSSLFEGCRSAVRSVTESCHPLLGTSPPSVTEAVTCRDALARVPTACDGSRLPQAPTASSNAWIELVFVPTAVPPYIAVPTGYAFDPYVMRGLFLHGRLEAIRRIEDEHLLERVGWRLAGPGDGLRARYVADDSNGLRPWISFYSMEVQETERRRAGRDRLDDDDVVRDCAEAPLFGDPPVPRGQRPYVPGYFGGAQCR